MAFRLGNNLAFTYSAAHDNSFSINRNRSHLPGNFNWIFQHRITLRKNRTESKRVGSGHLGKQQ